MGWGTGDKRRDEGQEIQSWDEGHEIKRRDEGQEI